MKKITDFIVEKRNFLLILFIILAGISLFLSTKVKINEDIMEYLPASSETKIGNDIMNEEFAKQDSSTLNVMFKDLTKEEKIETLNKLKNINGVDNVDYEDNSLYNKDNYTLYVINVDNYSDSIEATEVYNTIEKNFKTAGMSGSIYEENKPILHISIVIIAIMCAMIILIILSESYVEPFLYLISIGLAVFINKGTNIMFSSVSSITDSITAILQLALSMDYSIMLSNRFKQEKEKTKDKVKAMKDALYDSFKAISSSSITTIVGLLALVFMSFTIGRDLGFVLSKGVLLSLICIFLCLPALLLLFDNLILKTHKKTPHLDMTKLGVFSYKTRWLQMIVIVVLFITTYFLQGNTNILYTGSEQDEVGKIFPASNQIAIVYENKYEELISNYCKSLKKDNKIDDVLCYSNTINEKLTYNELNNKFDSLGQDTTIDEYLIKIIYYNYFNKDEENLLSVNDFIDFIKKEIYANDKLSDSLSDEARKSIDTLENFATPNMINKKRNINDIVSILDMDKKDAENILIYYNSKYTNTNVTIKDFVNFMLNDVAKDAEYSSELDDETIKDLEKLQKFSDDETINKKMSAKELADIFGIDDDLVEQLLLFYRIKSDSSSKITLNDFAKTALRLANDKDYQDMFDDETINSIKLLKSLSDEKVIAKDLNPNEMNRTLRDFGLNLNANNISLLYTLYEGYNTSTKITINSFANIALNLATNDNYKALFNEETVKMLTILQKLSDNNVINEPLNSTLMSGAITNLGLNIDTATINLLYTIYDGEFSNNKMTLAEFANIALEVANKPEYDKYFTEDTKAYLTKIDTLNKVKDIAKDNQELYSLFNITDTEKIAILDSILGTKDGSLTPKMFVLTLLSEPIRSNLTNAEISNLEQAYFIMTDNNEYTAAELANLLKQDKLIISFIYGVSNNNSITISIKDLINFIYNNKEHPLLASYIKDNTKALNLAYQVTSDTTKEYNSKELANLLNQDRLVVSLIYGIYDTQLGTNINKISVKNLIGFIYKNKNNSILNKYLGSNSDLLDLAYQVTSNTKTKYNYTKTSEITNTDKDQVKKIYSLYDYLNYETLISPYELTNLILDNLKDELLEGKLKNDDIDQLELVKKVMNNTINNNKVSSSYISDLLEIDKDKTDLLYGLYSFRYIKNNQNISLYNYIGFIIKEVMDNPDYSDKFNTDTRRKLNTIYSIMEKSLNKEKYNSIDLYGTLRVLNNDLDNSLVELVYLYNSSINAYDSSWMMTVEEFINYLNTDILNDTKFQDFIDDEMNKKITDAKETIDKSKNLIVSDKYSRVVLNTKYPYEAKETFNFINNLNNDLGNKDGIYVVGNSPMAVEMSKTFNNELNKITILTMIFIFVVVAITFKDILIPLILVLVIQCAVYITMSYISITGGSVYFISLLIVQAILMGATIDYAIVYTSYYKESRATMNVREAIINSYNKSIHTIINSASILIIVTLIVANFASAIAAKICETISQGALAAAILILFILPGVLASVDKIICQKDKI